MDENLRQQLSSSIKEALENNELPEVLDILHYEVHKEACNKDNYPRHEDLTLMSEVLQYLWAASHLPYGKHGEVISEGQRRYALNEFKINISYLNV